MSHRCRCEHCRHSCQCGYYLNFAWSAVLVTVRNLLIFLALSVIVLGILGRA